MATAKHETRGIRSSRRTTLRVPRSTECVANGIIRAPGDIERIDACFSGAPFAPHRHDTYAVGITLGGVRSFDYRGSARNSLPGQLAILHPDELHDGRAGDAAAFRYRTAYIAPSRIQDVLCGRPLPFIEGAVSSDPRLAPPLWAVLTLRHRYTRTLLIHDGHTIERGGPYRFVRHPGYLGSLLCLNGVALASGSLPVFVAAVCATLAAYAYRIHVEDALLVAAMGPAYERYCREVGALLPLLR